MMSPVWSPYLWTCFYLESETGSWSFPACKALKLIWIQNNFLMPNSSMPNYHFLNIQPERCWWGVTEQISCFNTALVWVESSQCGRKLAVFGFWGFFFFTFFFLVSSRVTCLTFRPINSRTTSGLQEPRLCPWSTSQTSRFLASCRGPCTRPRCRGNSVSAELWGRSQLWG